MYGVIGVGFLLVNKDNSFAWIQSILQAIDQCQDTILVAFCRIWISNLSFCKFSHKPFQCLDVSQHAMTDPLECTAAMGRFLRVGDLFLSATYPELLVIFPCRLLLQYTLQIKNSCKIRGRYKAYPEGG